MPQLDILQFDAVLLELMVILFVAFLLADSDDDLRNLVADNGCWLVIVTLRLGFWGVSEGEIRYAVANNFLAESKSFV